jgi:hypothetical protein
MKRSHVFAIALLAAASFSTGAALAADPTLHEVYQAVEAGHMKQAETMMDQVLRDHPNSAKAHFVEAELLAKEGLTAKAQSEFATAQRLAPGLPFARADAVDQLKRQLDPPTPLRVVPATTHSLPTNPAHDFPWGLLLIGLGLIAGIVWFVRSMKRPYVLPAQGSSYGAGANYNGFPQPVGAGGVGPVGPAGGGIGSGILGGLATGAAVGAGMVAGEALMHRVFDGSASHAADTRHVDSIADYPITSNPGYDMGGNDFGVSDGGSWDDGAARGGGSDDWS